MCLEMNADARASVSVDVWLKFYKIFGSLKTGTTGTVLGTERVPILTDNWCAVRVSG